MAKWSGNIPRIARKMQDFPPKWQEQAEKAEKITEKLKKGIKKGLTKCGGGIMTLQQQIFNRRENLLIVSQKNF